MGEAHLRGLCGRGLWEKLFERFMWEGLVGGACGRSSFEWFVWEGLVGEAI